MHVHGFNNHLPVFIWQDYVRQQVHAHGIVEDTFKDQDALTLQNIYSRVSPSPKSVLLI